MIEFGFESGEIAKGVLAALTLGVLLRARIVAALFAAGLALGIVWTLFAAPDAGRDILNDLAARLTELAKTGMLTGLLAGATLASLLGALTRTARGERKRKDR